MAKEKAKFEETKHYNGEATVKFYPGMHGYFVTDPEMGHKNQRMGGGTSLTGQMAKGMGLMLYPMYEMRKYLKQYFRSTTIEEFFDAPMNLDDLLKEATQAHVKKSDRGKSVGTDAHAWVEAYLRECLRIQELHNLESNAQVNEDFVYPEIPTVEELHKILRTSYIDIFKAAKPTTIDDYRGLSKLLFQDAEIQEALHIEATMLEKSITAAKQWFDLHDIKVHGTEDTVYSRTLAVCGKYDGDISVTCSEKCGWCYRNGDKTQPEEDFTGRYITDFKSTNESSGAPKGIYPEYLAQCGVYDLAKTEEFPDIKYHGHLILNGSKNNGTFNTHFSFERDRNRRQAVVLAELKEINYAAGKEMKASA